MLVRRDAWYIVRVTSGSTGALYGATRKKYSPKAGVERSGGCLREWHSREEEDGGWTSSAQKEGT